MAKITINLTEDEIKKIKKDLNNGHVYTDGCFCGHAISNFRDSMYVLVNFSCRKSMSCDNSYYQVNGVDVVEKASMIYDKKKLEELLESDDYPDKFDGRNYMMGNSYYQEETVDDIYLYCDDYKFDDVSLKAIQKKLFKYYKKSYGECNEAKFKDVGHIKIQ